MRKLYLTLTLVIFAACGPTSRQQDGDILVIGDSVLAWNRSSGGDVGSVIEAELGRDVVSRATFGARVSGGGPGFLGSLSIPDQLVAGKWNWVVMNGGANDFGSSCGCTGCEAELDTLISQDATTGAIPNLIAKAQRSGANVLWVGYYQAPESRSFRGCRPFLVEMEQRIAEFARSRQGVSFIDAEDAFDPKARALFAADRTHPSVAGSAVIGRFVAREIARLSAQ